ncbi:Disease resistance protein L6 [Linum perenne]
MLNLDSTNLTMVGLHGMGGIGKTTIAKAVYNKISSRFDRCCFLENIREIQAQKDGIVVLQKKLVSEILKMDSVEFANDSGGRKMIKERVARFKSLIILDDVDEKFIFQDILGSPEDFVSESRFIITSRNVNVLITLIENEYKLYEVGSLNYSHSLELFCKHAFRKNSPPVDYETLANDIVQTTGGLPLTLKVIGSLLYRQETAFWKDKLEQLRETLKLDQVMDRLKISYDTLPYDAQQIFLDIACFFIGTNKERPLYMWSDCKLYPMSNIYILMQRSMIKVGISDEFQMHDQLRDMGREIVHQEDVEHPWMRSRIWSAKEAIETLSNKMGSKHVKAIRVATISSSSSSIVMDELRSEYFSNFSDLKYLDTDDSTLTGDFNNLLPNFRCWDLEIIPYLPKSLEVLILKGFHDPRKQEVLNIGELHKLKKLILGWSEFKEIKGTFGMLKDLLLLGLDYFRSSNLREGLSNISEFPSLLVMRVAQAKDLLDGIKHPTSLKILQTCSSICNLAEMLELEYLEMIECDHGLEVPLVEQEEEDDDDDTVWWKVSKLNKLGLFRTKLRRRSTSTSAQSKILLPSSLTEFCVDGSSVPLEKDEEELNISIINCPDLTQLLSFDNYETTKTLVFDSLLQLHVKNCPRLDVAPLVRSLPKFPRLEVLKLDLSDDKMLGLSNDNVVEEKDMEALGSLEELKELSLRFIPSTIKRMPWLSKLQKLYTLEILGTENLQEIPELGELSKLTANEKLMSELEASFVHIIQLPLVHLQQEILKMSYIRGVATMASLVLPLVLLYKLWYGRRSSDGSNNNDNGHTDSTFMVDQSSITPDSADPSSSLSFPSVEYEVFLSFRGPDTRHQITDILYRFLIHIKIHTFKDDDELRKGERIWSNLVKAIDQSKIYIPIISKSYAHSKWCLKELAEIVECKKRDNRRIILPIFYMVDPRDVRNQTGPYQDAFKKHVKSFDEKTIQSWKNALNVVGTLKGWHVRSNDEQGAISDEVSSSVWSHLSKYNYALDIDELIGIDDHVEAVVEKLSMDSENMIMVGIHGIGGIGKTTIARAVYNQIFSQFERCCFVENIRETQDQKRGIVIIQEKLTSDILRMDSIRVSNDDEGRRMIKDRICRFKTLIILDDVDEKFKFEDVLGSPKNFHHGSRFIITSRNIKVLGSLNENQCRLYEVGAMSQSRSLELFCKHAFKKNYPPPNYNTLVDGIVSTTGGLPLTLKVIGSMLYREELAVWQEKLEQLRGTIEHQVMGRLKISYDTLTNEAQQLFLDIACFFIGENKEMPSYMWSDCKFYPASNINILIQRSMIKLGDKDVFQMHDQLRDMGREIIRQENIEHPWMRSRIWSAEEGKKLIYERKMAERLKLIDLSHCSKFQRLPRFPRSVEILKLNNIEGQEIPELDIGDLKKLKVLYLNYSKLQKITGGTFGMLKGLQELDLTDFECKNLREVMVDVGELSSLKILRTKGSREVEYETPIGLKELSTSSRISNLAEMLELEVLKIYDCKFGFDIPPMWWNVSKLKFLSIDNTNINGGGSSSNNNMITTTMLPSSLTYLQIYQCHAWLPSLVNLGNLTYLEMVSCQTLCNHLDGIERMTSLKNLLIYGVKGLARIIGLTDLLFSTNCKLESLVIVKCPDLIELHDDDKAAEVGVVVNSLRIMNIVHCPLLDVGPLVRGLTTFPMLWVLCLENIKFTEHKLEGVGSLQELEYCFLKLPSLERITPLSKLQKLKRLIIAGAHGLREIEGLGELKCLETLILANCTSLERLWHADDRLENLKKLDIRNCRSLSVEHLSALEAGLPPNVEISWPDEPCEDEEIDSRTFFTSSFHLSHLRCSVIFFDNSTIRLSPSTGTSGWWNDVIGLSAPDLRLVVRVRHAVWVPLLKR